MTTFAILVTTTSLLARVKIHVITSASCDDVVYMIRRPCGQIRGVPIKFGFSFFLRVRLFLGNEICSGGRWQSNPAYVHWASVLQYTTRIAEEARSVS